jgi:hypothetical protein
MEASKKKAVELAMKFDREGETDNAIKCAKITVDEILMILFQHHEIDFWKEVKQHLNEM